MTDALSIGPVATRPKKFHHALHAAEEFDRRLEEEQIMTAPTTPAVTAPAASAEPVSETTEFAVVKPATTMPPAAVPEPQGAPVEPVPSPFDFTPAPAPSSQPLVTPVDNSAELRVQYEAEKAALQQQLTSLQQQLEAAKRIPDELQRLAEEHEIRELINQYGAEFNALDPEDARKLLGPVVAKNRRELDRLKQDMLEIQTARQQEVDTKLQQIEAREKQARIDGVYRAVLSAIPNFEEFKKSEEYQNYMRQPLGKDPFLKNYHTFNAAVDRGDVQCVLDILREINVTKPSLDAVASVSSTAAGSASANSGPVGEGTPEELDDINYLFRSRQITREEFHARLAKYNEAQNQRAN